MLKKHIIFITILLVGCAGMKSHVDFYTSLQSDLKNGNFTKAENQVNQAREKEQYLAKDKVLFFLDNGAIQHYSGDYIASNRTLEQADKAMESLFTKSITKAALSLLLNDNVLEYSGEISDNIYVNVFKAINYIKLDKFDDALVEVNRVNDKLRAWENKYSEWVEGLNSADSAKIQIEQKSSEFYDDVLAHYISYLLYRADGEYDNSRISYEKMRKSWDSNPEIYKESFPRQLDSVDFFQKQNVLNVISFTGNAPRKYAAGGQITTYKNTIHFSDLTYFKHNTIITWDGIEQGYHFKFSFPEMEKTFSDVDRVEVFVDNKAVGNLELLEDMSDVSISTFEANKHVIYFKTLVRTILKGLASEKAKKKLRQETDTEDSFLLGAILNWGVDMVVDATENPDLRSWRTLPQKCFIGEYYIGEGEHNIEINFISRTGSVLKTETYSGYTVNPKFNLIEPICLQ